MAELDILKEALCEDLFIGADKSTASSIVKLVEDDRNAKLKEVELTGLPRDRVILKMDKITINSFFKAGGPNKRCDYLILTQINGKRFALFIELKSTYPVDYVLQFKGAVCLTDYCENVLNQFYKQANLLKNYERRFVLFYKTTINKTSTRIVATTKKINNSPEKALRYPDPHIVSIKSLVG